MDFHVNAADVTSSLAAGKPGSSAALLTRTVEVRKVPVLRLEDVLAALPDSVDIAYLKTDVQGVDLQVLQSAGERLRRVLPGPRRGSSRGLVRKGGREPTRH